MLVSTIVATRNRPGTLGIALDAIARQSHRDLEIIVVDDGSDRANAQASEALVAALGARARYLRVEAGTAIGPAGARNIGIGAARGALVAFCDDDDHWSDDGYLEFAVAAFARDASLDLLFANQEARSQGALVRAVWLAMPARPDSRVSRGDCLASSGDFGHMNTCVFRRELLLALGGFWEDVRYCEDEDLFVRAVDRARRIEYHHRTVSVHNIPDAVLGQSASTQLETRQKHLVKVRVAGHLLQSCTTPEARAYAANLAGYVYRHLARAAAKAGNVGEALDFARRASSWRPTLKWSAYAAWLRCRAWFTHPSP